MPVRTSRLNLLTRPTDSWYGINPGNVAGFSTRACSGTEKLGFWNYCIDKSLDYCALTEAVVVNCSANDLFFWESTTNGRAASSELIVVRRHWVSLKPNIGEKITLKGKVEVRVLDMVDVLNDHDSASPFFWWYACSKLPCRRSA